MTIENRGLWLARSFALSRYNHRAVIIALKASSFLSRAKLLANHSALFSIVIDVIILMANSHLDFVSVTIRRYSRRLWWLIVK